MAYLTVAQLRDYARSETGSLDDAWVTNVIATAQAAIDRYCQRNFDAYGGGGATALSFVPTGTRRLDIPDCTTVTSITENGTTLASTYWQAEPVGGRDGANRTVPYNRIMRIDGGVWAQTSGYPGKADISVTATWGWASTPEPIVEATRILAKDLAGQRDVRSGLVTFGEFAARAIRNPNVTLLLDPFKSIRAFGIA